jgi:peptide-methionine (S)-S-oxide reductase
MSMLSNAFINVLAALGLAGAPGVNAAALPAPTIDEPVAAASAPATAIFAGGCFWGVEAVFAHVKGVKSATSGYSGGDAATAKYTVVGSGRTGHAEAVKVTYDPAVISYGQLLKVFFSVAHDPTQLNRQGPDVGTQYRSAIFYSTPDQKRVADAYVAQLNQAKVFGRPIVTEIAPLKAFYQAEDYHQNYLALHPNEPYIVFNDMPKLAELKQQFPDLYSAR